MLMRYFVIFCEGKRRLFTFAHVNLFVYTL